jgi:hypothetical protein
MKRKKKPAGEGWCRDHKSSGSGCAIYANRFRSVADATLIQDGDFVRRNAMEAPSRLFAY